MASLAQFSSAHLLQLVTVAVNSSIPCMHNTTTTLSDDDILYTGIYSYFMMDWRGRDACRYISSADSIACSSTFGLGLTKWCALS